MAQFYTDHNVARKVVFELNLLGHDARSARDLSLEQRYDDEHLLIAAEHAWILITNDRDFIMLDRAWRRWSFAWNTPMQHSGVLLMPQQMQAVDVAKTIDAFLESFPQLSNHLWEWRLRDKWVLLSSM